VIGAFADVPLGQTFKTRSFGQDHSEHGVDVFNARLLAASHGIAIKDGRPEILVIAFLEFIGTAEFRASIRKEGLKDVGEVKQVPEGTLQGGKLKLYGSGSASVHKARHKKLAGREIKRKDALKAPAGGLYRVHFPVIAFVNAFGQKVRVSASDEHASVRYLCFVTLARLELYLSLEVRVARQEQPLIDVVVKGLYGNVKLRMVCNDHVW